MEKRVAFCTLGCKVSQYETEAMSEAFAAAGYTVVPFESEAELYVINTCTVTRESDRKSRQMIRRARRTAQDALIFVTGCYAQVAPHEIARLPGVAFVGGNDAKMKLVARADALLSAPPAEALIEVGDIACAPFEPMSITHAPRTRAYVKIEDGCECRCSYCIIPTARGSVRSKLPEDVVREVACLVAGGVREVVLTGIETASWGVDLGAARLPELLARVARETGIERIRLGSLSPEMMTPRVIEALASLPALTPHFHLSMQSGSDTVLRAMRRRYSAERALRSLEELRRAIPDVQFTTDMMVGFPGETEELFLETMEFCRAARFLSMHVFAYSRRPGTDADAMPNQVEEHVKGERSARLIALARSLHGDALDRVLLGGAPRRVLFETRANGVWHGHSDEFIEFACEGEGELHGEFRAVAPLRREGELLIGRIL